MRIFLTLVGAAMLTFVTHAQIPNIMSYQGIVTDDSGDPLPDGQYQTIFRFYDAEDGGSLLWEEEQNLILSKGIISTTLGKNTAFNLPFDQQYWLGIQFAGNDELTPRTPLTASPYALNATATLVQPEPGQTLVVRSQDGTPTHVLDPSGTSVQNGMAMFMGGIQVPFDSSNSANIGPVTVDQRSKFEGYTILDNDGLSMADAHDLQFLQLGYTQQATGGIGLELINNATRETEILTLRPQGFSFRNSTGDIALIDKNAAIFNPVTGFWANAPVFFDIDKDNMTDITFDQVLGEIQAILNLATFINPLGTIPALSIMEVDGKNMTKVNGQFKVDVDEDGTPDISAELDSLAKVLCLNTFLKLNFELNDFAEFFFNSDRFEARVPALVLEDPKKGDGPLSEEDPKELGDGECIVQNGVRSGRYGSFNGALGMPHVPPSRGGNPIDAQSIAFEAPFGVERGRFVGSTGNFGINTTSPQSRLDVNGEARMHSLFIGADQPIGQIVFKNAAVELDGRMWVDQQGQLLIDQRTPGAAIHFRTDVDPLTKMLVTWDGNVGIGTTTPDEKLTVNGNASKPGGGSWNTFSDVRLKDVHGAFEPGLQEVMGLNPISYSYKSDNALQLPSGDIHYGFTAQNVQETIPEAVSTTDDGYLVVNNDPVILSLVNAVKELSQANQALQLQLASQQQQINAFSLQASNHQTTATHEDNK